MVTKRNVAYAQVEYATRREAEFAVAELDARWSHRDIYSMAVVFFSCLCIAVYLDMTKYVASGRHHHKLRGLTRTFDLAG